MFGDSFSIVKLKESVAIERTAFPVRKRKEIFGDIRNDECIYIYIYIYIYIHIIHNNTKTHKLSTTN